MNTSDSDDQVLARLMDLPAAERASFWQRRCAQLPGLGERLPAVTRLLAAMVPAPPPATVPITAGTIVHALESALEPGDREAVGTQIGPYKLLQQLGEGGFGTVWMADQLEPLRRRVALKIIKVGLDTEEVIARFEVERQALWEGHSGAGQGEMVESDLIRSVAWSPDGTRLVQNNGDGESPDRRGGRVRVWDVRTRQPVTDIMPHPDTRVVAATFSPDGRWVETEAIDRSFRFWPVPPPLPTGAATPEWLLELATLAAGRIIDVDGNSVRAAGAAEMMESVRRTLNVLPADAPYSEWGRWLLADPAARSIAPGFTITPAGAGQLAAEMDPAFVTTARPETAP